MAGSDTLAQVRLTPDDIPAALALSDEAGWNQTADDWRLFIERGNTIGVREAKGKLVASAAALPYEREFGFVAMVLVTAAWRRQGLATRLLNQCVDHLHKQDMIPVLDATPAGAMVYRQQGFSDLFALQRWQSDGSTLPLQDAARSIRKARRADREAVIAMDASATGAARAAVIGDFMSREGSQTFMSETGSGFLLVRRGRRACQIGPVVAAGSAEAAQLLAAALSAVNGPAFIDVPVIWTGLRRWLAERGFTIQRDFSRMALGRHRPFGHPDRLFAVAGPEFG
jgi:GNAT superfamily N-acetyltransferase